MKNNNKINKFKLIKYKNKLVPIVFGIMISLSPSLMISSIPSKTRKKVKILASLLTSESFKVDGKNGLGEIKLKKPNDLPKQVEIKYAKKIGFEELKYQNKLTRLNNNDEVYIKISIKEKYKKTHEFTKGGLGTNDYTLNFVVKGLLKQVLQIKRNIFEIIQKIKSYGTNGLAFIDFKLYFSQFMKLKKINLQQIKKILKIEYAKKNKNDYSYEAFKKIQEFKITNLTNDDILKIKFSIEKEYEKIYKFPSWFKNTIFNLKPISGLKRKKISLNMFFLQKWFKLKGINGEAEIFKVPNNELESGIDKFPSQLKVEYAKSKQTSEHNWQETTPYSPILNDLKNGDIISFKFSLKPEYEDTHIFKSLSSVVIRVGGAILKRKSINTEKIQKNLFEFSGVDGNGKIGIKSSIDNKIFEKLQVKYAKKPKDENTKIEYKYLLNDLRNDDIVLVKFFIKDAYKNQYGLNSKFTNPLELKVQGLELDKKLLTSSAFKVVGINKSGQIKLKDSNSFPYQAKVKYGKKTKDGIPIIYSNNLFGLQNGDKVSIKFFINDSFKKTHKLPSNFINPIEFTVRGLKQLVNTSKIKLEMFQVTGISGQGEMKLKIPNSLPSEIIAQYSKKSKNGEKTAFSNDFPTNLSNGDKVSIKFSILNKYLSTHKFPSNFLDEILFLVRDLPKKEIEVEKINKNLFKFSGKSGEGIIELIEHLPSGLKLEYAKKIKDRKEIEYKNELKNLSNNDIVIAKFSIIDTSTHKFPKYYYSEIKIEFPVNGLEKIEVDTTNLNTRSFEVSGTNGNGIMKIDTSKLPNQVEAKYAKVSKSNEILKEDDYSNSLPNNLSNNDKISIKFYIKDINSATHEFPSIDFTNPIVFKVVGLQKEEVSTTNLNIGSFKVSGKNGEGIIAKDTSKLIPSEVEVEYAKMESGSPSTYSKVPLTNLNNNDKISIRFSIKEINQDTHKFPTEFTEKVVVFTVGQLQKEKVNTYNLNKDSFKVTGTNGKGVLTKDSSKSMPPQVKVEYAKIESNNQPGVYLETLPTGLSTNDKISIKFSIQTINQDTHKFPTEFTEKVVVFTVGQLQKEKVNTYNLNKDSFKVTGTNGKGVLTKDSSKSMPPQVKVEYAKIESNNQPGVYLETLPTGLSTNDKISIKFSIQTINQDTHKFPTEFTEKVVVFTVGQLQKEKVNTYNLNKDSFKVTGTNGKGVLTKDSSKSMPPQVKVEYAKIESNNQPGVYLETLPTGLSTNDKISIKFSIQTINQDTHKFPTEFTEKVVVFTVGQLQKEKVNTYNLNKDSFKVTGTNGKGVLTKDSSKSMPPQVKVEYAKIESNNQPGVYLETLPTGLSTNDKISIKFSIQTINQDTHKFPTEFTEKVVVFTVGQLQKEKVNTYNLNKDSFKVTGTNGKGVLTKDSSKSMPPQVKVEYAKIESNNQPGVYLETLPTGLSTNDKISIKFSIQTINQDTHKFPTEFTEKVVVFTVGQLQKEKVNTYNLNKDSFKVTGTNGKGVLTKDSSKSMPPQVKVEYAKIESNNQPGVYLETLPTSLSTNDKISIKFSIQTINQDTHEFPTEFTEKVVVFTVGQLQKEKVNTYNLNKDSFKVTGTNGKGVLTKDSSKSMPPQVKVEYAKIESNNQPGVYLETLPTGLSTNDKISIKFSIQTINQDTHKFPTEFTEKVVVFTVGQLQKEKVNTYNLNKDSFKVTGTNGKGVLTKDSSKSMPPQVKVEYAKIESNNQPGVYLETLPTGLSTNDKISIKFSIQTINQDTHKFPTEFTEKVVVFTVGQLQKEKVNTYNLNKDSFKVTGTNGKGVLTKDSSKSMPPQVKVEYAKIESNNQPGVYLETLPTGLSTNDKISIKFSIQTINQDTHKFPTEFTEKVVVFTVGQLQKEKVNTDNLNKDSFKVTGTNGKGVLTKDSSKSMPPQVKVEYAKIESNNQPGVYLETLPTSLSTNDKISIKFSIQTINQDTHKFPTEFTEKVVVFTVGQLQKEKVNTYNLNKDSFKVTGTNGKGVLTKDSSKSMPPQVKVEYAKIESNNQPGVYLETLPTSLSTNDKISIKFSIQTINQDTHKFPTEFTEKVVVFTVGQLQKEKVNTYNLNKDSFKVTGTNGKGVLTKDSSKSMPPQVKVEYAKIESNNQPGVYLETLPTSLSTNDKISIKFSIQTINQDTHKFPTEFTEKVVVFTVGQLQKEKVNTYNLNKDSFKVTGTNGKGVLTKDSSKSMPPQVKVEYAKIESNNQPGVYLETLPTSLSTNDKISIKFSIQTINQDTHKFPTEFTEKVVVFTVGQLQKEKVNTDNLNKDSFKVTGTNGKGVLTKDSSKSMPPQVKVEYAKIESNNQPGVYLETLPTSLSTNDKISIKFSIQTINQDTHKFPTEFTEKVVVFTVGQLQKEKVNTDNLNKDSFKVTGTNGKGVLTKDSSKSMPPQVKVEYAKIESNNQPGVYLETLPTGLSTNDKISIKFSIQTINQDTHKFPTEFTEKVVVFTVGQLQKEKVNTDNLNKDSFKVTGTNGKGVLTKDSSKSMPPQVKVEYAKIESNNQPGVYLETLPTSLITNDKISIKFSIQTINQDTHKFPTEFTEKVVVFTVGQLQKEKVNTDNLNKDSFKVTGTNGKGVLTKDSSKSMPPQVKVEYAKKGSSSILSYSISPPNNLKNNDKISIKFSISDAYKDTHKFPTGFRGNVIEFTVIGLEKTKVDISQLNSNSFKVIWKNNVGRIKIKKNVLPLQLEVKYAKKPKNNKQKLTYYNALTDLRKGDEVIIKFFIKSKYKSSHDFPTIFINPIEFSTKTLKTTTNNKKTSKLSKGAIVGVSILGVVVTAGVGFLIIKFLKLKKQKQ